MPNPTNPYLLPTLAGNQFGKPRDDLNPTRNRPNPRNGDPQPWGVNNRVRPHPFAGGQGNGGNGTGYGGGLSMLGGNPTSGAAMGGVYRPNPVGNTAGYAYAPRQFEADKPGVAYTGTYVPSDPEAQKIWAVMPAQTKQELAQWASAGAGAYTDALLKAQQAGPNGIIFNGQYMSGDQAFELIKAKAREYMSQLDQARMQGKGQPQPTDWRITVGG